MQNIRFQNFLYVCKEYTFFYSVKGSAHVQQSSMNREVLGTYCLFIRGLKIKIRSIVLLPSLYSDWEFFISSLLIVIIATTFHSIDSSIIGLRFWSLRFPVFGSGLNCPKLSSIGVLPVSAIFVKYFCYLVKKIVLCSLRFIGYFNSSIAFSTSLPVVSSDIFCQIFQC